MGKAFIIPKIKFFHPGKPIDFNRLLHYLEQRPGVMQQPLATHDGSTWVDHGLGSNFQQIGQRCDQWQSRRVLGRHLIIAPDPKLLDHVPQADRPGLIARTTEATISRWYQENGWGTPQYAYVLHDKEKPSKHGESMTMMHAHIILPGTILPDPDLRRQAHFISRPHILDLHRTASESFQTEFTQVLGQDRAQQVMRERHERVHRERREAWLAKRGGIPLQNRDRVSLDWSKLSEARSVVGLMHQQKRAKQAAEQKKEKQKADRKLEIRRLARQLRATQRAREAASHAEERARRIEAAKQRRLQREAEQNEALEQVRQQHMKRLEKLRDRRIPYIDVGRGRGISR